MTTICGHERDVVRLGIQILALSDNATAYADQIERDHNATGRIKSVTRDLDDPAKLAELLAEALRERGVGAGCYVTMNGVLLWEPRATNGHGRLLGNQQTQLTTPQARAALLRVLSLPEGATAEDAVKVVAQ
jgi:hypothetical protein